MKIHRRTKIGSYVPLGTSGSVLYIDANGKLAQDNSNFFWDYTNKRIGIGENSPGAMFQTTIANSTDIGQIIKGATSQSSDMLQISSSTGTGDLLTVDANGNVGIGTNAPNSIVDIRGADTTLLQAISTSTVSTDVFKFFADSSETNYYKLRHIISGADNWIRTQVGFAGVENIRLDPNPSFNSYINAGNFGVGTTSPNAKLDVLGDARLGDSTTNYVEVESDGDINFVGGAGLQYGGIYAYEAADTITISGTGIANKVQVTTFDTNGNSNGSVTPDHTNDHITVGKDGDYDISVAISCESAGAGAIIAGFAVYINNGATLKPMLYSHRKLSGGGGDVGSVTLSYKGVPLSANDTVELWTWNDTNTDDIVIDDVAMSLVQIGG